MQQASYLLPPSDRAHAAHGFIAPRQLDIEGDTALAHAALRSSTASQGTVAPRSSTDSKGDAALRSSTVSIKRIEARRRKLKITIRELCTAAGVRVETYADARAGRYKTQASTLDKLSDALGRLAAGREEGEPITLCLAMIRLIVRQLAERTGWDAALMLSQDFSEERTQDPVWKQAARLRRCALYLLAEGLGLKKAALAAAIGVSRQAVQKTVAEIEAERERSPDFDALMQTMMDTLKG
jgi:transcriptional regulator with XRE-family HTH domain